MEDGKDIIGHFGLGFYSALWLQKEFKQILYLIQKDAEAVTWVCEGGTEYEMAPSLVRKDEGNNNNSYLLMMIVMTFQKYIRFEK